MNRILKRFALPSDFCASAEGTDLRTGQSYHCADMARQTQQHEDREVRTDMLARRYGLSGRLGRVRELAALWREFRLYDLSLHGWTLSPSTRRMIRDDVRALGVAS